MENWNVELAAVVKILTGIVQGNALLLLLFVISPVGYGRWIHQLNLFREVRPPLEWPGYKARSSDGEDLVLGLRITFSPLRHGVNEPVRVLSMGENRTV